jgi:hypothetical protein
MTNRSKQVYMKGGGRAPEGGGVQAPEEYQRSGAHSRDSLVRLLRRIKLEYKRRPEQLRCQSCILKFDLFKRH